MTGFGAGDSPLGEGRLTMELRALNHRFLDVRVRLPAEIGEQVAYVEQLARERLDRGRVDVGVRLTDSALPPPRFSLSRARALYASLKQLGDELAPGTPLPVATLAHFPELLLEAADPGADGVRGALKGAFERALERLTLMREAEGAALSSELRTRLGTLRELVAGVRGRAAGLVEIQRAKLRERVERLLGGATSIDPSRLESEIALLADRTDATEELARLDSHFDQFERTLDASGPVGRKLDFLLQEIARELNTLGSKSPDAGVAHLVVEAKTELERIREQVQNVE
ncbi:MAG TPA: YicC/YloC family endoribonuclease [Polyangiaceae bacterium]